MLIKTMYAQHAVKRVIKPLLFRGGRKARRVKSGIGRGIWLFLDRRDDLQREFGLYEIETHEAYRHCIAPESVVYDIGAGDGDTSLACAALAHRGQVFAFEGDPDTAQRMTENLRLNPELAPRVSIVVARVGDHHAVADDLVIDRAIADGMLPAPAFVKIDVDGGEIEVLRGMRRTLLDCRTAVLVEVHSSRLEEESRRLLQEWGYRTRRIDNARWRIVLPEWRPLELNRWLLAVPATTRTSAAS